MEKYKEETSASYNKNVLIFSEKFKGLLDLKRRPEFNMFMEKLPGNKILDLGCGGGDHSSYFSKKGLDVTCIDISEEMVRLCNEKNLNALKMDIEDLKFNDNSFDGIWAVTSLLHIPKKNLPKVIDKLFDILKSGGILFVCLKKGDGEGLIKDTDLESQRFFSFWEKEQLLELFKNKFDVLEYEERSVGKTVYLQFQFKSNKK